MSEVFGLRATFAAAPAEVFHALTDAETMCGWLAERAEVSLPNERSLRSESSNTAAAPSLRGAAEEDQYEFWGRTTPQGEPGRQRLLTAEPDRRLGFQWSLDGVKTTVDMSLAPAGDGTELTLRHEPMPTLDELMAPKGRRDGRHTMHTFWPMAIGNLSERLAGQDGVGGCDFSASRPGEIRIQVRIPAPADAVFASITEPAVVEKWWGYAPEIEPRVGGKVTFGAAGHVEEWEPGRVFAYTEEGVVTRWELAESDGQTTLTFVQSGFGEDELDNAAQHDAGWRGGLLELKRMHTLAGDWTPLIRELPE